MQPRSPEAPDPRYAEQARRPRRRPRGRPRRDFLPSDDLFALCEPGDDLRIDSVCDANRDVANFLTPVILDDGHCRCAWPQTGICVGSACSASAAAATSPPAATTAP